MKLLQLLPLCVVAFLAGCASTGVVPMGRDTYMLSKNGTAISVGSNLKADLYREADTWCRQQGLLMVPISESQKDGIPGTRLASAEIVFRAVKPGDIEDQRTNLQKVPDAVVEVRTAANDSPRERRDEHGLTAATYEELARKYDAEGNKEMADLARTRASKLR